VPSRGDGLRVKQRRQDNSRQGSALEPTCDHIQSRQPHPGGGQYRNRNSLRLFGLNHACCPVVKCSMDCVGTHPRRARALELRVLGRWLVKLSNEVVAATSVGTRESAWGRPSRPKIAYAIPSNLVMRRVRVELAKELQTPTVVRRSVSANSLLAKSRC
jgi:hypothetical protein